MKIFSQRILTLFNVAKEIEGGRKLQEMIYILKSNGIPFEEKFKYYYYGPYSPDLQLEVERLSDIEVLIEKEETYSLNKEYEEKFEKDTVLMQNKELIKFLNGLDSEKLELISTIFFLENNLTRDEKILRKKIGFLKPYFKNIIDRAFYLKGEIEKKYIHNTDLVEAKK